MRLYRLPKTGLHSTTECRMDVVRIRVEMRMSCLVSSSCLTLKSLVRVVREIICVSLLKLGHLIVLCHFELSLGGLVKPRDESISGDGVICKQ